MLKICGNSHEEISFQGNVCPLCLSIAEKDKAERDRDHAQGEADKLRATVEKMIGKKHE
jgi:hypothetical protein